MGVLFYSEIPKDNKKQAGVSDRNVSLMLLFYYVHKITGGAAKFREKAEKKGLRIIEALN